MNLLSGHWKEENISTVQITALLKQKIDSVSFTAIKEDVIRFIKDDEKLDIWSPEYFKDLVEKLKVENRF